MPENWIRVALALVAAGAIAGRSRVAADRTAEAEPDLVETLSDDSEAAQGAADVVETIDSGPVSVAPAPATLDLGAQEHFQLHGWLRQSLELGFARDVLRNAEYNPLHVPYDALVSRTQLYLNARYARGRWFEATLSGALSYSIFEQGPPSNTTAFNGINGQATRWAVEPMLLEAFIGLFAGPLDVRVGQQRVAWGRSEFLSPNDVLNARDGRNPFVSPSELRVLPTLMLRADLDLGFGSLQAIVAPAYEPARFDAFGSNWAAVQPGAPAAMRGLAELLRGAVDPSVHGRTQSFLQATKLPAGDMTQPVLAGRFSWSAGDLDVNHYYQYGFDGPFVAFDPRVSAALAATDFANATLSDLEPVLRLIDEGGDPISVTFTRRHHFGTDAATVLGPLALRLDVGFDDARVFYLRDLTSVRCPTLQAIAALEYQGGDLDKVILLEGMYMRVMDVREPLMIWDRNNYGLAALLRWKLWGPFRFEVRALVGFWPRTQVLQPQLDAKFDAWLVSVGGLWLSGEPFSFGGYFHRNSEVYAKLGVSF